MKKEILNEINRTREIMGLGVLIEQEEKVTKEEGKTSQRVQGEPGQIRLSPSNTNRLIRPRVLNRYGAHWMETSRAQIL